MRIPQRAISGQLGFNMTPMIDVVFLLIIFFLVSSHMARQESQMELPLPAATQGQELTIESGSRVIINITQEGRLLLAGRTVTPDQLQRRLQFELQHQSDEMEVRIRGDRGVPFALVRPILLACARAGIWNVTFAVVRPGEIS